MGDAMQIRKVDVPGEETLASGARIDAQFGGLKMDDLVREGRRR